MKSPLGASRGGEQSPSVSIAASGGSQTSHVVGGFCHGDCPRRTFHPCLRHNTASLLQDSFGHKRVAKIGPLLLQGIAKPFLGCPLWASVFFSENNRLVCIILNGSLDPPPDPTRLCVCLVHPEASVGLCSSKCSKVSVKLNRGPTSSEPCHPNKEVTCGLPAFYLR